MALPRRGHRWWWPITPTRRRCEKARRYNPYSCARRRIGQEHQVAYTTSNTTLDRKTKPTQKGLAWLAQHRLTVLVFGLFFFFLLPILLFTVVLAQLRLVRAVVIASCERHKSRRRPRQTNTVTFSTGPVVVRIGQKRRSNVSCWDWLTGVGVRAVRSARDLRRLRRELSGAHFGRLREPHRTAGGRQRQKLKRQS